MLRRLRDLLIARKSLVPLAVCTFALAPAAAEGPTPPWTPGMFPVPGTSGEVRAMCAFDDGTGNALYVGGYIEAAGTEMVNHVARFDGHQWSGLAGGMDDKVYGLTVYDDGTGPALYAAGWFTHAGGIPANYIARWNGQQWSPVGEGLPDRAFAICTHDDGTGRKLYASVHFRDDTIPDKLAVWDGVQWSYIADEIDGFVKTLHSVDHGPAAGLYMGGGFTHVGTLAATGIARWDGQQWHALGAGLHTGEYRGFASALETYDDGTGTALYVGGGFAEAGDVTANHLARWDGTNWSALPEGIEDRVDALCVHNFDGQSRLIVASDTGNSENGPVRVLSWNGQKWSPVGSGNASNNLYSLCAIELNGKRVLFAGGYLYSADDTPVENITRFEDGRWQPVGPGLCGNVRSLRTRSTAGGTELIVTGDFSQCGTQAAYNAARWNGRDWQLLATDVGRRADAVTTFDDGNGPTLYVGSWTEDDDGQDWYYVKRWDEAAQSWQPLGLNFRYNDYSKGLVNALTVHDAGDGPHLYAGGSFNFVGDERANGVAQWNGSKWVALGDGLMYDNFGGVAAHLASWPTPNGNLLIASGEFKTADGLPTGGLAAWDGTSWSPVGGVHQSRCGAVYVFDDGFGPRLYVGHGANGVSNAAARWDGTTWEPLNAGLERFAHYDTYDLCVHDDGNGPALYAAGWFLDFSGDTDEQYGLLKWQKNQWVTIGGIMWYGASSLASINDGWGSALYATSRAGTAGGVASGGIARWGLPIVMGDLNCDGVCDSDDITPFVLAISSASAYADLNPHCGWRRADINNDGVANLFDIDSFVDLLIAP